MGENFSKTMWILAKALRERTVFLTDDVFDLIKRSECYYIYHRVFISCTQPFSTIHPESVLNAAALVYNCIPDEHCGFIGISMPKVLSTLAKQASVLDANLTVKLCFDKLKERKIPPPFPQMKGESSDFNVSIETLLGYPFLPF